LFDFGKYVVSIVGGKQGLYGDFETTFEIAIDFIIRKPCKSAILLVDIFEKTKFTERITNQK
jgi:hypothetical protein